MMVRKILYCAVKNRKGENGGTKEAQWCREKSYMREWRVPSKTAKVEMTSSKKKSETRHSFSYRPIIVNNFKEKKNEAAPSKASETIISYIEINLLY
jgi:hypothetical protein